MIALEKIRENTMKTDKQVRGQHPPPPDSVSTHVTDNQAVRLIFWTHQAQKEEGSIRWTRLQQ